MPWKHRLNALIFLLSTLISAIAATPASGQQAPALTKPKIAIFDPYPFEEVFVGNLEPASTLGATGVTALFNSNTRNINAPAIVLSGAFPLAHAGGPRASGWAVGAAAGTHDFTQEASSTYTAGAYFWELMIGRSIVREKDFPDAGARGYLEVAFRNQRPRLVPGYSAFLDDHKRVIDDRNTAIIFRAGSSMDPEGEGFVQQRIAKVTPAIDFSVHMPVVSQHAILLRAQLRMPFQCFAPWMRCNPFVRITNARNLNPGVNLVDVQNKLLLGSQFIFLIRPKYLLSLQFHWAGYFGPTNAHSGPTQNAVIATPFVRTSFTIAF